MAQSRLAAVRRTARFCEPPLNEFGATKRDTRRTAMIFGDNHPDSEDMFAESRMTFGEHIEELRKHMLRAIVGFVIALCGSIFIGEPVLEFIAAPVEHELMKFHTRRVEKAVHKIENGDEELTAANAP